MTRAKRANNLLKNHCYNTDLGSWRKSESWVASTAKIMHITYNFARVNHQILAKNTLFSHPIGRHKKMSPTEWEAAVLYGLQDAQLQNGINVVHLCCKRKFCATLEHSHANLVKKHDPILYGYFLIHPLASKQHSWNKNREGGKYPQSILGSSSSWSYFQIF